jgi:hypothetical protein
MLSAVSKVLDMEAVGAFEEPDTLGQEHPQLLCCNYLMLSHQCRYSSTAVSGLPLEVLGAGASFRGAFKVKANLGRILAETEYPSHRKQCFVATETIHHY